MKVDRKRENGGLPEVRYSVHVQTPNGPEEIGSGFNLEREITFAKEHHARYGRKTWVVNEQAKEIVFELERRQTNSAGGGR